MAATTPEKALQEEVKEYQYFQPELIEIIASENIYDEDRQQPWEDNDVDKPYLKHVKSLSSSWRHLRLLADFMQVGTTPLRWKGLQTGKWSGNKPFNRKERLSRTRMTRLDYHEGSNKPKRKDITTSSQLRLALDEQVKENGQGKRQFRLFVVEDLSRDVIEMLGAHYDVEPAFFRDQIVDYAWYNTRDRWMDPPRLNVVARKQRWLQIRFATSRYFKDQACFKKGCDQFESFNVYRRVEDDINNTGIWDAAKAIVGLSRTRAAFWIPKTNSHVEGAIGILLVDPTVQTGFPLWHGYRNWEDTPSMKELEKLEGKMPPPGPTRKSFFDDLIYWLEKPEAFGQAPPGSPTSNVHIPIQALLYLVCGEWLTIAEYVQTRLAQVEWEIAFPGHFLNSGETIEGALGKLHIWRRLVPLYHRMLTETLQRVFDFPCHLSSGTPSSPLQAEPPNEPGPIKALREDFARVLVSMEEFQEQIDRLTSVVTASISIDDSHRGLRDTTNVTRLTWLATCFIPLSLTASVFSMQEYISTIKPIIGWYFLASFLLVLLTVGGAVALTGSVADVFRGWRPKGKKKS